MWAGRVALRWEKKGSGRRRAEGGLPNFRIIQKKNPTKISSVLPPRRTTQHSRRRQRRQQ
jgi:hypothetical protein